jgi:glycosyltransferase involved in cell wall biosynthesis
MRKKLISYIFPIFNEEGNLELLYKTVSKLLETNKHYDYELLFVNDGSKDKTAEVVKKIAPNSRNLKLIDNQVNKGKGGVVRDGMLAATGDIRLFMDADNSTKVDEIIKFIPQFDKGFDLVIGSRRIRGSVIAVHQGLWRDFLGGVFRTIVHTLVPVGVTDTQCGFKAMTAKAAEQIFPKQTIFRWAFDVEILALARKMNFKIQEVPITWVNDDASHVSLKGQINMLFELIRTRWNLWTGKYE